VDNGQTLEKTIEGDNVRLFPSKNVGGAGGFTRGMIEAIRSDEQFTHVLLMDDDVEFFTESFDRTRNLLRYVKPEHQRAFVSGSMFSTNAPAALYETLALRDGLWVRPLHSRLDVVHFHNVLVNDVVPKEIFETPEPNVDSAWWYCCIPVANVETAGLPMPLFIRGDDVEYAWRHNGTHHISLNGICVWHEAFENRINPVTDNYFLPRNMFILNAMYVRGFQSWVWRHFCSWFARFLLRYDYPCAEILLQAMEDLLRGPECLREDPRKTLARLKALPQPPSHEVGQLDRAAFRHDHPGLGWKTRLVYKLTLGGMLLPTRFFRKTEGRLLHGGFLPHGAFALRKRVHVLNERTGECVVLEFDRWKILKLGLRFASLLWKLYRNYARLQQQYRETHSEFKDIRFWEGYLELDADSQERSERHLTSAAA